MFSLSGRRASAFFATVALTVGLTACSGDTTEETEQPTASQESEAPAETTDTGDVAESCDAVNEALSSQADALQNAMTSATSGDTKVAVDLIDGLIGALNEAEGQVTNAEVKAATTELRTTFEEFQAALAELDFENLDITDEASVEEFEKLAGDFEEIGTQVQEAGIAFDELCATA